MSSAESPDDLLTLTEAAAILGVQYDSVKGAVRRGALLPIEIASEGPRTSRLRLRRADVEAYAANRKTWKRKIEGWEPAWQPFSQHQTPPVKQA